MDTDTTHAFTHMHTQQTSRGDPHLLPWEWVRLLLTLLGAKCSIWAVCVCVCVCECVRGQKVRGRGLRMGVGEWCAGR